MDIDVFGDSLAWSSRDGIDVAQLLTTTILTRTRKLDATLPLRKIHSIRIDLRGGTGRTRIYVLDPERDGNSDAPSPDFEASHTNEDEYEGILRRMSHALIESGLILIAESRFQRYWTSQEYRVVIDKVVFETRVKPSGDTLNAIIRMVQAKRVKVEVNAAAWLDDGRPSENSFILTCQAVCDSIATCEMQLKDGAFPNPTFLMGATGHAHFELIGNQRCYVHKIIKHFKSHGYANENLRSVFLQWHERVRDAPDGDPFQLGEPTITDDPVPEVESTQWIGKKASAHVSKCEKFVFSNQYQHQRLDVAKWTVTYGTQYWKCEAFILMSNLSSF